VEQRAAQPYTTLQTTEGPWWFSMTFCERCARNLKEALKNQLLIKPIDREKPQQAVSKRVGFWKKLHLGYLRLVWPERMG
jgi:hypothetical protein